MYKWLFSKQAYSLIELLVVMVIVILVIAGAVGIYKKIVIKSQILEVFAYAEAAKANVEQYFYANGSFPSSAAIANYDHLVTDSDVVEGIYYYGCDETDAHQFAIELLPDVTGVSGNSIVMVVRDMGNGKLKWYCKQAGDPLLNMNYLPSYCVEYAETTSFCDTSNTPTIDP